AALQSVTQRVEELAAALQSEQQKHHDAIQSVEQQLAELRARLSEPPRAPSEHEVPSSADLMEDTLPEVNLVNGSMNAWAKALKIHILGTVHQELEAFKDQHLLDLRSCNESVKHLELTMGHVSQELNQLLQKVGGSQAAGSPSGPNRTIPFDSILCSAKTTLEGAFLEYRDDDEELLARGHRISRISRDESVVSMATLEGGAESTVTCTPQEITGPVTARGPAAPETGMTTPQPPWPQQGMYLLKDTPQRDHPRYLAMQWTPPSTSQTCSQAPTWHLARRSLPVQRMAGGGNTSVPVPVVMRRDAQDKRVVIVPPTAKPPVQGPGLARSTTGTLRDVRRGGLQPTSQRATINFPLNEWKGQAPAMPKLFPGTMRMKAPQAGS
ncbi:Uncharacterized protein SCF082_LOCUS13698, partial [Durusdinium trenchii]